MSARLGKVMMLVAMMGTMSAQAYYRPGWERPIQKAQLEQVEGNRYYPQPQELTMNKRDGSRVPTSFLLTEDTGIRCITTPCPSESKTSFTITHVQPLGGGSVKYTAYTNVTPGRATLPAMRALEVVDHSKNVTTGLIENVWEVYVGGRKFVGNPEGVITPQ